MHSLLATLEAVDERTPKRAKSKQHITKARELANQINKVFKSGKEIRRSARPLLEQLSECVVRIAKIDSDDERQQDLAGALFSASLLRDLCNRPNAVDVLSPRGGVQLPESRIQQRIPARISGRVLVVDDQGEFRRLLREKLKRAGAQVEEAVNGEAALRLLRSESFDLILLDVHMPVMDGYKVLKAVKKDPHLRDIPVVMLSASDPDVERVAKAIEMGAEDYLTRPYDSVLLSARVNASLDKHALRVQAQQEARELERTLKERDALLQNIFPPSITETLRSVGHIDPVYHQNVTIAFTDFVGFSNSVSSQARPVLIERLHEYFSSFDDIMGDYGLEKLKTIGDSYMFAGGVPNFVPSCAVDSLLACFALMDEVQHQRTLNTELSWDIRIGLHSGPVVAGVVGKRKYAYDVWGATVNLASRMESTGAVNQINVSAATHSQITDFFDFEERGELRTKDGKTERMYFVRGIKSDLRGRTDAVTREKFAHRYGKMFGKELPAFPQLLDIPAPAGKASA